EDLIHNLNKKTREKIVPYPRFISLLLEHMMPEYNNEELAINLTQAKSLELKVDSEENNLQNTYLRPTLRHPKSKTGQSEKDTRSSSTRDKSLSHPSPPTPMVGEMHKEAQQVAGVLTSLGATSEEGAHLQLSSDGLKTAHTDLGAYKESRADDISHKVTDTLTRFSTMVKNASGASSMNVPSTGKATALPAEGEKNTKDASTNLKDELIDLLGKNVMTQATSRSYSLINTVTRC
nr:hypothetical protein [Tanacetum cinerariifolium]